MGIGTKKSIFSKIADRTMRLRFWGDDLYTQNTPQVYVCYIVKHEQTIGDTDELIDGPIHGMYIEKERKCSNKLARNDTSNKCKQYTK